MPIDSVFELTFVLRAVENGFSIRRPRPPRIRDA